MATSRTQVTLDKSEKQLVELNEVENGDKYYRQYSFPPLDISALDPDGFVDLVLPHDFWFLSIEFFAGPLSGAVLGDTISALVDPVASVPSRLQSAGADPTWGEITAELTSGSVVVDVSPYLMGSEDLIETFFRIGTILQFEDPGTPDQPHDKEYVVWKIDRANNRLHLAIHDKSSQTFDYTTGVADTYASGSKIWRTVVPGDSVHVLPTYDGNQYGQSKIGSSKLPAFVPFRIYYKKKNGSATSRTIRVNIEGMVGDRPSE